MLKKKDKSIKIKFNISKIKRSHMKHMKLRLKILKFCIRYMNKICLPTNDIENEALQKLIYVYDETIKELNESVDIYRKRIYTR